MAPDHRGGLLLLLIPAFQVLRFRIFSRFGGLRPPPSGRASAAADVCNSGSRV